MVFSDNPKATLQDAITVTGQHATAYFGRVRPTTAQEQSNPELELVFLGPNAVAQVSFVDGDGNISRVSVTDRHVSIVPNFTHHVVTWERVGEVTSLFLQRSFLTSLACDLGVHTFEIAGQFAALDPLTWNLGRQLQNELQLRRQVKPSYLDSLAFILSQHLLRAHCTMPLVIRELGGLPRHKLRRAIDFMSQRLDCDITFRNIAEHLEMSPYHFARMFKHSTGVSPHHYMARCRVERAKEMLMDTKLSISEISLEVGYKSQSYFTTCFAKAVGLTPAAFRSHR